MAAPPTNRLQPPAVQAPVDGLGNHTLPWASYHQDVADELAKAADQMATLSTQLAAVHQGVTDGSEATAGDVGEYQAASGSGALSSAAPADRATLTLPAGDWDVAGSAQISPNVANMTYAQAWLGTAANTPADPGRASIQSGGTGSLGITNLVVGPVRFLSGGPTTVHLGCQANFPGGTTVTASAFIRARRMR